MRPATLLSLALLGLIGTAAPALAAPPAKPSPAQTQPQRPSPAEPDDDDAAPSSAVAPTVARSGAAAQPARAGERRRRSYASCNRESQKRNLSGGARRRFLIRCKLGYERRQPAASPAAPAQPQPGKRP